jgi:hypothetical protein
MSFKNTQSGFGHIGVILFVLAVAVIGFSAVEVINANNKVANSSNNTSTTAPQTASVPSTISNKTSLQQASAALNDSNTQAQSELSSDSLNSSINAML